jgi:dTMP kinase
MYPNPGPGRFVAFEGLDGAGTTTQVRLLAQRLRRSRSVFVTHEPSDGPAGLQIRMVLAHRIKMDASALAALFAADRMDHLYHTDGDKGIVPHLQAGIDVITDRYYLSSFAYQGMNLDWDWLWNMHDRCIRPDVTFFLDVPVDVCLRRIAKGRGDRFELFENKNALTRVRQSYLAAIDRLRLAGDAIEMIDGNVPSDRVHDAIWARIQSLLAEPR